MTEVRHVFWASEKRAEQIQSNLIPPVKTEVTTENVILLLSVLSSWRYVFISQKAYQESETRPESSVYTVMKGSAVHGDQILDTVEYARPSEVSSKQMSAYYLYTWLIVFLWHFPHRVVMSLVQYWDEKSRMTRCKEPALRWVFSKSFLKYGEKDNVIKVC